MVGIWPNFNFSYRFLRSFQEYWFFSDGTSARIFGSLCKYLLNDGVGSFLSDSSGILFIFWSFFEDFYFITFLLFKEIIDFREIFARDFYGKYAFICNKPTFIKKPIKISNKNDSFILKNNWKIKWVSLCVDELPWKNNEKPLCKRKTIEIVQNKKNKV